MAGRWCRETDPRSPTGVAGLSRCWYCRGAPEDGGVEGSGEGEGGWGREEGERRGRKEKQR